MMPDAIYVKLMRFAQGLALPRLLCGVACAVFAFALTAGDGSAAVANQIKVMFCDCATLDENSVIQNEAQWVSSTSADQSTIRAMVQGGWIVQSIVSISARQFSVTFEKSASAPSFTDARIMVCDCATLDEDTQIQGPQQWRAATAQDTSTTRAMVQAGWTVQSIIGVNARQSYVVFVKGAAGAPALSDAKIMICDCALFDEDSVIQGPPEWAASNALDQSTPKAMAQSGWALQSVSRINARQFYLTFVKPTAPPAAGSDMRILLCDCALFDEDSVLQRASAWATSATTGQTTAYAMVQLGWTLHSVVAANLRQLYVTFVQNPAVPVPATTGVKVVLCDACVFDETSTVQGPPEWSASLSQDQSTPTVMEQTGWRVNSIVRGNSRQYYLAFARTAADADFDIDGDGRDDAYTDGMLILRYLFGLRDAALVTNVLGPSPSRPDTMVQARLDWLGAVLDVDGDGRTDALTDGVLIVRRMFGITGPALVANAVSANATRSSPQAIIDYVARFLR